MRPLSVAIAAALAAVSCNWVSLAKGSLTYGEIQRGEAANLAAFDTLIYATRAEDGLEIVDARSGRVLRTMAPPLGSESIDDVAIAGALLFVLDARTPGRVSVYSLGDPLQPRLVSPPRDVAVGPFSGISAGHGVCIVSGGTSELTAWQYDTAGVLSGPVAVADLGRGQPDVLVAGEGPLAYVATHYWGPYFGLDILRFDPTGGGRLETLAELALEGAGFTEGGAKPASFPIEAAALGGRGDTVLVAYARGVAVVNAAAPGRPALVHRLDVGGPAVNVDALGAAAVVAVSGPRPALVVLDFSGDQGRVTRRIPLAAGTLPMAVALTPWTMVVAARERGVLVFNR